MCPFIPTTPHRHRAPAASRVIRPPPLEPHYVVRLRNGAVFEHRDSPPDPRADVPAVDGRSHETRAYKSDGAAGRRSVSSHPRLPAPGAWSASGPRGGGPEARDPNFSIVHSAHAAAWHGRSLLLLRSLSDHGFGRDHQAGDRRGVLQRDPHDLRRIDNAGV
jgi:hypothetical protein